MFFGKKWINKMDKQQQNIWFFNKWAKSYDRFIFGFWMRYVQRKCIKEIISDINHIKNKYGKITQKIKILEVACGTGYALEYLSKTQKRKLDLYGIDLSKEMIKISKEKLGKNAQIMLGDVEKLPYKNGTFDYVFCTESFHHFPDPIRSVTEMKRILKKGGKLILSDINFIPLWLFNILFKIEPGFIHLYSKKEFKKLFEKCGLRVISQKRVFLFSIQTTAQQ